MPRYDYQCESCSHVHEEQVSYEDREVPCEQPCPECGLEGTTKRVTLTTPSVVGYHTTVRMRTSDNFNDRLKDIAKGKAANNTIKDAIR